MNIPTSRRIQTTGKRLHWPYPHPDKRMWLPLQVITDSFKGRNNRGLTVLTQRVEKRGVLWIVLNDYIVNISQCLFILHMGLSLSRLVIFTRDRVTDPCYRVLLINLSQVMSLFFFFFCTFFKIGRKPEILIVEKVHVRLLKFNKIIEFFIFVFHLVLIHLITLWLRSPFDFIILRNWLVYEFSVMSYLPQMTEIFNNSLREQ